MRELKKIFSYAGPYRRELWLAMVLALVETALELVIPVLMADILDVGVDRGDAAYIWRQGLKMGACALLALLTGLLHARYAARAAYGFGAELRKAEYSRIQQFSFSNLDRFETSSLVTRMTTDVTVVQNAIIGGLRPLVRGPAMLVMGVGLSIWMSPRLALVFVVCAPVLGLILAAIVHKIAPLYGKLQRAVDRVNAVVEENLTAIRAVKAFVRGEYEEEKFSKVNAGQMQVGRETFRYAVLNLPAFQLVMYTAIVLILWFGGRSIIAGQMQVGRLTGFLSYVLQVMNSLMMISNVFLLLTRSLASAHRIVEVLEEQPGIAQPPSPVAEVPDGRVDLEGVCFKCRSDAEEYALSDIELHIPAGQTVGVIGGTGSAKSTLVQLIPRLYDATRGWVLVGGRDVREYDLTALRDAVGIVLQKNVLFSGTIRDNLRWGNPDAGEEELWQACRLAQAEEFLLDLPQGLDTDLGQGGVNLSGGQKQRLCIARTLLKQPKVLIFDDSTSAVDTATEGKIRTALAGLTGVTKIIIAQRLSSIREADQIVILDDGRIHAVGTHEQLLREDPIYREMEATQRKGGEEHGRTC